MEKPNFWISDIYYDEPVVRIKITEKDYLQSYMLKITDTHLLKAIVPSLTDKDRKLLNHLMIHHYPNNYA